jgi:hypothetical protein
MHWFYSSVVWKDDSVKCNVEVCGKKRSFVLKCYSRPVCRGCEESMCGRVRAEMRIRDLPNPK